MSDFLRSYLTVGIFGLVAVVLVAVLLGIGRILRPSNPTVQKLETYESGVDPTGDMWSQSNIRYYIFALLFVMFDVEAVFIFPWATRLEAYELFGLIEMAIFIYILLLGLLYAWRKGMLRWV
ncbi:MAG: NADH-quinone oxidoreductase subunit A [Acidimicrobiales bacterium]|nr:NADH-quinone oxidoreductase subunit A [Acidimicrobiales bacterium]